MSTPETLPAQIQSLHALFIELTGRDLPLDACGYRYSQWLDWIRYGQGDDQKLRVVVAYVKRGIQQGQRHPGALKFQNLIVDWPRFADDYAQAMQDHRAKEALKRCSVDKNKAQAVHATGRTLTNHRETQSAQTVLERLKMAEMLRNWREEPL